MGSGPSRATQFQPPDEELQDSEETPDDHHISISNKMVERLVEDAALAGGAAPAGDSLTPPRGDHKDQVYMDKLTCLDDKHSQRYGLTIDELNATAMRIELRTANMVSVAPVCAHCKEEVIECYNNALTPADTMKCWETVGAFTKCVQDAATSRLRERTKKDARDYARRTRHVAHAREHALRDLGPPLEIKADRTDHLGDNITL